jgi:sugar transferase (PEP-CTERM/EpsH1 system associated)
MVTPVVQVLYSLEIGGVEKLAVTIGAHLDRKRFRPAICALDRDGVLSEELVRYGIPHYVLWRKGIEAGVLRRLYRCFRQEKARVVHTHQFAQLLFSLLPAKACGARIVHTEHEYYLYRQDARARRIFRQLMRFCSAFTVVGPAVARYYAEELGVSSSRMHVIANAVDLEQFRVDGQESRARLGLSKEEVVLGIVGRLEPEKDHRTLLRAFRALNAHHQATRLLIVGDGSLRRELESQCRALDIERNVTFLGARADIPHVLAAFDVFVLSSVQEGVPLSVVEAMGAGKPVIATDVGGLRLLVKPALNGLLVPPADPVALEAAMRELTGNAALRQEMGRRSRQIAQESFGVSTMIDRYQELYDSVLGNRDVRN